METVQRLCLFLLPFSGTLIQPVSLFGKAVSPSWLLLVNIKPRLFNSTALEGDRRGNMCLSGSSHCHQRRCLPLLSAVPAPRGADGTC